MILWALGPDREIDYDNDGYAVPASLPLLRNHAPIMIQTMLNLTSLP